MRRAWWLGLPCFAALVCLRAGAGEGTVVDFDGLRSRAPAAWKEEEVKSRLRYLQFRLPKVKDDKADTEVVIFKGIGGSAKANIDRWKGMFAAPEGKSSDDIATVKEMKVGEAKISYLDISGTYLFKAQPFNPSAKAEKRPNSRMLGVVFEGPRTVYHIRLVGYADTVGHYKKGFDEWLKNFK